MSETIQELKDRIKLYEEDGATKLFYALNRKANELAALLNKHSLSNFDIADAKDKSFERMKIAWTEAATISSAIKNLESVTKITGDEQKDTQTPIFRITPENMADNIGQPAGQR